MPESFWDILKKKVEEMSFIVFLFGAILVLTGTAENIKIFGQDFATKNEFRLIVTSMGFVFVAIGIILAVVKEKFNGREKEQEYAKELEILRAEARVKDTQKTKNNFPPLHTFHGLKPELRCQPVFQNFRIDRSGQTNRNAVYYMWADTYVKNTIHA